MDIAKLVAAAGTLVLAITGFFQYFNYRTKRDRTATVGASFASTVDALASENETLRMAGAVLLRRFFDRRTEQGAAGTPYVKEAIELMAGMLREEAQSARVQKVLADGLRYAVDLHKADLQRCDLRNGYIGRKTGDQHVVDLTDADLFEAKCAHASFKGVVAYRTVFYGASLEGAVLTDADCREANFREAKLSGSKFGGARIGGAIFADAEGIPDAVANLLDDQQVGLPGAVVPKPTGSP